MAGFHSFWHFYRYNVVQLRCEAFLNTRTRPWGNHQTPRSNTSWSKILLLMCSVLRRPIFDYQFLNGFISSDLKGTIRPEYNGMKWFCTIGSALVRTKLLILYLFWWARVCWPLLCLCRPFCRFEPESCRRKQARYQLSHPSPTNLATHFPNLATRLTNLATNLPNLATHLTNLATQKMDRTQLLYCMFHNSLFLF